MGKIDSTKITAEGHEVTIRGGDGPDYISLTDMAKYDEDDPSRVIEDPTGVVANWMRGRSTISFLGLWESLYNPAFNKEEYEKLKSMSGRPSFTLSPKKWIESTNAIGIQSKAGRGGGTFAHKDVAFEFASWLSPRFKLMLIVDYQRFKGIEATTRQLDWAGHSGISLMSTPEVPKMLTEHVAVAFNDDDIINIALFGYTEEQWKETHPDAEGKLLDTATFSQVLVRSSLVSINRELIASKLSDAERITKLNKAAIEHMELLKIHGKNIQEMDKGVMPTPPNIVTVPTMLSASE